MLLDHSPDDGSRTSPGQRRLVSLKALSFFWLLRVHVCKDSLEKQEKAIPIESKVSTQPTLLKNLLTKPQNAVLLFSSMVIYMFVTDIHNDRKNRPFVVLRQYFE